MAEREHASGPESAPPARAPTGPAPREPMALALQRTAGNRAVNRLLQRMETAEEADMLQMALGSIGVDEMTVNNTLTAHRYDIEGFDKLNKEYGKKIEAPKEATKPLVDALETIPDPDERTKAKGNIPRGWYPGIIE